jgi:hypothetical protein
MEYLAKTLLEGRKEGRKGMEGGKERRKEGRKEGRKAGKKEGRRKITMLPKYTLLICLKTMVIIFEFLILENA